MATIGYHSKYPTIKVSTESLHKVKKHLEKKTQEVIQDLIDYLSYIGETCVKLAREPHNKDWDDQTGNLRSSIGYVVLQDGQPVIGGDSTFKQTAGPNGDGAQGLADGKAFLQSLQGNYSKGIVLIVVAGMKYAAFVENHTSRIVLAHAQLEGEKLFKQLCSEYLE